MTQTRELIVRPIGRVTRGRPMPPNDQPWEGRESEIEIDPEWTEALDGLDGFSHIWVVWWLDRAEAPSALHIHPENRQEVQTVGLFATRTPRRPNPIAMTAVRFMARKENRLLVQSLDAYEGTPIVDLKPYHARGDSIPGATEPGWLQELWRIYDLEQSA